MKREDSELPVSAARPARTSSFPKRLTSIRGGQWIFTNPFMFWLPSCCRRCCGSVCALCSRHKLVVFFCFWLGGHVFLAASGAWFWQSGPLCGLSAFLLVIQIIFTREEWRSAHRHCRGDVHRNSGKPEGKASHTRCHEAQTPLSSLRYQCFNSSLHQGMKRHRSIYRGSR